MPVSYIQAMNSLGEVDYSDGENTLSIRKGTSTEDISGDYNSYSEEGTLTVGENTLTIKGKDGKISLAVWNDGTYSYAISGSGLTSEQVSEIAEAIM